MGKNIVWHPSAVSKGEREQLNRHKSFVLWFTGLSGSGKSTIANALDRKLFELGKRSYLLDGDNIRHGLNKDLGFGEKDRRENIRRIGEVAKLFTDSGQIVLTAFISPFAEDRKQIRSLFPAGEFFEIYVDCPLEVCERRDPKGLYKKARNGEIKDFTGIDSPYERPEHPELEINSAYISPEKAAGTIINYLKKRELI
ncbi:adenylyl-sulfate kinase [Evansella sp. LMS18]|uniref:adenylyl-sulfate kinase n=1 Tax=Evansella sp. LMS18 TaxID=2924033 RepID=UPI0020D0AB99|nr:adenylyl-sulfate kinase [Evansella sp. LMS18]UTR11287.1 adenylyl-sulfate kinase [Evansella sp. LMS18]